MKGAVRIAIDGPAGAGKSSVAKAVARAFSIAYLDTGAMYRALGLRALESGVSTGDEEGVGRIMESVRIAVANESGNQRVYLDGRDVTGEIRTAEVSRAASDVSRFPRVRERMVEMQQAIAARESVVMDGRDIGTHVMPFADCKFYLTASVEERARRRFRELTARGAAADYDDLRREIAQRDRQDMSREHAPLRQAPDAVLIDTTPMSEDAVIEKVIALVREKMNGGNE